MLRSKKAQSTIEVLVLMAAVIAVLLVFLGTPASPFRAALTRTFDSSTNGMETMAERFSGQIK